MEKALRVASLAAVIVLGIPPALDVSTIGHPNQRALAAILLGLAGFAGIYAAVRRQPLGARATTAAYGTVAIGFGLFVTARPLPFLLAYVVGLIGMNVLLYHVAAYGPVLAAFRDEDAIARRARAVVLRSLAISGGALALAYGGSLALLPLFAFDLGLRDPLTALAVASALIVTLMVLAVLPETPLPRRERRASSRSR